MEDQSQKVRYAIHKIKYQNNEVVKAWIDQELALYIKNQELKEDETTKISAIGAVTTTLASIILQKPIILGISSIFYLSIAFAQARKKYYINKEQTYKEAIFNYETLKEYETLHPKEKKITTKTNLKNINKQKILKRISK